MSKPCRACGEPIDFRQDAGRWVPIDPATKADHAKSCSAKQGRVADKLRRPAGHHVAAYKVKLHDTCPKRFHNEHVLNMPAGEGGEAADAGKLGHSALEVAVVERAERKDFRSPVTVEELHGALDKVVARERWTSTSLAEARSVLAKAAPRLDLSFVAVDEWGPIAERKFELPIGDGVIAGGTVDLVEDLGSVLAVDDWKCGHHHDPDEHRFAVGLYGAWYQLLYPNKEVRVVLHWLALDVDPTEFSGNELAEMIGDAKATTRALVLKIRARGSDASAWPAKTGAHCAHCPFSGSCDAYQARTLSLTNVAPAALEPETLPELLREIHRLAPYGEAANAVLGRLKALKDKAKPLAAGVVGTVFEKGGRRVGRALVEGFPIKLSTSPRKGFVVEPSVVQTLTVEEPATPLDVAPAAPELQNAAPETGATVAGSPEARPEAQASNAGAVPAIEAPAGTVALPGGAAGAGVEAAVVAARDPAPAPAERCRACDAIDEGADPYTPHSEHGAASSAPAAAREELEPRDPYRDPMPGDKLSRAGWGYEVLSVGPKVEGRATDLVFVVVHPDGERKQVEATLGRWRSRFGTLAPKDEEVAAADPLDVPACEVCGASLLAETLPPSPERPNGGKRIKVRGLNADGRVACGACWRDPRSGASLSRVIDKAAGLEPAKGSLECDCGRAFQNRRSLAGHRRSCGKVAEPAAGEASP